MPHCPLVAMGWRSQVAEPAQAPGRQPEPRPPPQGEEGAWEQPLALQGICLAEQEAQRAHRQAAGLGSRGKHYPDSGHCQHLAGSWALPAWGSSRLPAGWTLALDSNSSPGWMQPPGLRIPGRGGNLPPLPVCTASRGAPEAWRFCLPTGTQNPGLRLPAPALVGLSAGSCASSR